MDSNKKKLIILMVFILSLGGAFYITKMLKSNSKQQQRENIVIKKDSLMPDTSNVDIAQAPIELKFVSRKKMGDDYIFTVGSTNVPTNIRVKYRIRELKNVTSTNGSFKKIPGSESGSYTVELINAASDSVLTEKSFSGFKKTEIVPNRMNEAEFKKLLIEGNAVGNPGVAKVVTINTLELNEGEKPIGHGDLQAIYDKIENGIWKSVIVLKVGYDEFNRINQVTIKPDYK